MHDLQHKDHRASRPPVGVLAARLAQARAEREFQRAREQEQKDAAGIVTDGAGAAPPALGQAEGSPLIEAMPPNVTPIDGVRPHSGAPDTVAIRGASARVSAGAPAVAPERDAGASGATTESGEVAELRAQAQRARDELAAARRRGEREKEEYTRFARGETVKNMLPVLDDLERALSHVPAHLRDDPWTAGMALVGESMSALLRREGVERIDPHGQPFDPRQHEAIARVEGEGDGADGHAPNPDGAVEHRVTRVYRPGYLLNGRVLRPAQVQVTTNRQSSVVSDQ